MWTPHLEVGVAAPFLPVSPEASPEVEAMTSGLRIAAEGVAAQEGVLRFRLLLTYSLASPLFAAYVDPSSAVEVVIERPETAQAHRLPLVDPFNEYKPISGDNYRGDPSPKEEVTSYRGRSVGIALEIPLPERGRGPHVYVTAYLRDLASNTLAIDADTTVVTSTERG